MQPPAYLAYTLNVTKVAGGNLTLMSHTMYKVAQKSKPLLN